MSLSEKEISDKLESVKLPLKKLCVRACRANRSPKSSWKRS